jgi:uncharacterized membrane protein YccC
MRNWFRSKPGLASALFGAIFALILFLVPGRADMSPVNVVLDAVLGAVFAASMYASLRARRPPST